ncbi:MAG: hypothetical protein E7614_04635 [Ruminococcaceae bacterium]|nr:hypothetical protein [Oscillospiraceae bacterium]
MKKITALVIALLLSLPFLTACGDETSKEESKDNSVISENVSEVTSEESEDVSETISEEPSEEISEETSEDVKKLDLKEMLELPEVYKGHLLGKYMESVIDIENGFGVIYGTDATEETGAVEAKMYVKDPCLSIGFITNDAEMSFSVTVIYKDGEFFLLNDEEKIYEKADETAIDMIGVGLFSDDGSVTEYVGAYEEEIKGVKYAVEEYRISYPEEDGIISAEDVITERYYFENEKLAFLVSDGERVNVEFTNVIPDEAFEIPADYTEKLPATADDIFKAPEEYKDIEAVKAVSKYNAEDGFGIYLETEYEDVETKNNVEETFLTKGGNAYHKTVYTISEIVDNTAWTIETFTLLKDGKAYDFDTSSMTYYDWEWDYEIEVGTLFFFKGLTYVKTFEAEIDGVTYTVDEFENELLSEIDISTGEEGEEYNFTRRFYTLDGELKFIEEGGMMSEIKFFEENEITDDLFDIPFGYEYVEDTENDDIIDF